MRSRSFFVLSRIGFLCVELGYPPGVGRSSQATPAAPGITRPVVDCGSLRVAGSDVPPSPKPRSGRREGIASWLHSRESRSPGRAARARHGPHVCRCLLQSRAVSAAVGCWGRAEGLRPSHGSRLVEQPVAPLRGCAKGSSPRCCSVLNH